jgi:GR25 family glycosyltransferase involved in LPS biosynthesis
VAYQGVGIYYINLASRPDRRAFMEAQLSRLGLIGERIEAVTPTDLDDKQIRANCLPYRAEGRSPSEVACSLSHISAWQRFLASDHAHGVVLEDDVALSAGAPELLAALSRQMPATGILKLDTTGNAIRLSKPLVTMGDGYEVCTLYSVSHCSAAYLLDRPTSNALLTPVDYLHLPVDLVLFDPYGPLRRRARINQLNPAVAINLEMVGDQRVPLRHVGLQTQPDLDKLAASDLQDGRTWREATEKQHDGKRPLARLWHNLGREVISGGSKFMQDYVWGVRKHIVPFRN